VLGSRAGLEGPHQPNRSTRLVDVQRAEAQLALVCALGCLALGATGCFTSSNSYWFCWNNPAQGGPHHLGYRVSGDHICSDDELKNEGGPPR
jgi:hypothetical protein